MKYLTFYTRELLFLLELDATPTGFLIFMGLGFNFLDFLLVAAPLPDSVHFLQRGNSSSLNVEDIFRGSFSPH
jgi:hypothetical protein